ncbi:hypothetical protein C0J52_02355 [Blattella germanica]|nr:hypothetical protein C0J52_02355 [Blattella germanica]
MDRKRFTEAGLGKTMYSVLAWCRQGAHPKEKQIGLNVLDAPLQDFNYGTATRYGVNTYVTQSRVYCPQLQATIAKTNDNRDDV